MTITVKPNVMEKEEVRFKSTWNLAIANAEKSLMETLQSHLERVMAKSKKNIRDAMAIEETIRSANQEWQERNRNREKRRLEAAKNPNPKKKALAPAKNDLKQTLVC